MVRVNNALDSVDSLTVNDIVWMMDLPSVEGWVRLDEAFK